MGALRLTFGVQLAKVREASYEGEDSVDPSVNRGHRVINSFPLESFVLTFSFLPYSGRFSDLPRSFA